MVIGRSVVYPPHWALSCQFKYMFSILPDPIWTSVSTVSASFMVVHVPIFSIPRVCNLLDSKSQFLPKNILHSYLGRATTKFSSTSSAGLGCLRCRCYAKKDIGYLCFACRGVGHLIQLFHHCCSFNTGPQPTGWNPLFLSQPRGEGHDSRSVWTYVRPEGSEVAGALTFSRRGTKRRLLFVTSCRGDGTTGQRVD